MSAKPKPQSTEIDHIRDTLTGVINIVGETRQDVKIVKQQQVETQKDIARLEQKIGQHDKRFDHQDKEIAGLRADNSEIKEMLKTLLSR